MKKLLYLFLTMLEAFCLAGACGIQVFTRKKMGMARYVIYKNREWEAVYPMESLMKMMALLLVVLTVGVFLLFLKRKKVTAGGMWFMNMAMIVFTVAYAGFTWYYSVETLRAYYMISMVLAPAVLFQIIKTAMGTLTWKHEE